MVSKSWTAACDNELDQSKLASLLTNEARRLAMANQSKTRLIRL
jgi:hypothetical protein